jgi:hypothetical protein
MAARPTLSNVLWGRCAVTWLLLPVLLGAQQPSRQMRPALPKTPAKAFDTPQEAADALIDAAEKFDVGALEEILGSDGDEIVLSANTSKIGGELHMLLSRPVKGKPSRWNLAARAEHFFS